MQTNSPSLPPSPSLSSQPHPAALSLSLFLSLFLSFFLSLSLSLSLSFPLSLSLSHTHNRGDVSEDEGEELEDGAEGRSDDDVSDGSYES